MFGEALIAGTLGALVGLSAAVFGRRSGGYTKGFHPGLAALAGFVIGVIIVMPRRSERARPRAGGFIHDMPAAAEVQSALDRNRFVTVHYYATWCAPCRRLAPVMERLARRYHGQIVFLAVDVDRLKDFARSRDVEAVPVTQLYVQGERVEEWVGPQTERQYRRVLDSLLEQ